VALVEVRNLVKIFDLGGSLFGGDSAGDPQKKVRAVDDVSLDIHEGETLGLVGESGSGKSTLGRLILQLVEPTSGAIVFDGVDLLKANGAALRRVRRDMQIIFQDPFGSLDPRYRVEDVIAEPLTLHRDLSGGSSSGASSKMASSSMASSSVAARRERVRELLRAVGMDESAMRRYPHEFSGGQRQRIGIARALALRPKFIVADEPVSALDVSVGAQVVNLLRQLQREFGLTYLFISHSMPTVRYLATRIAVMYGGKIIESGNTEQITTQPQHNYTRSLLSATPQMATS
jgi:oligopeptide transport system ATP-binding protein